MHIGIDVRMYGTFHRGIGRYVERLILGLAEKQDGNRYTLFASPESKGALPKLPGKFKIVTTDVHWYTLKEHWVMPKLIKKSGVDVMHWPHLNASYRCPVPFVVTIHDLIVHHFPDSRATTKKGLVYALKLKGYTAVLKNAIKKAQRIISVSEYTKQDIVDTFGTNPEKIVVTHLGIDQLVLGTEKLANSIQFKETLQSQFHIKKPYLLYVGAAYPHKNLDRLVSAFTLLRKKHDLDYQLVFVGRIDEFYKRLQRSLKKLPISVQKAVVFTDGVKEKELDELYRGASLFVFPSLYEGFGLPPLEALSRGIPVVSSDRSSMPEVLGDAAVYCNPNDDVEIARVIAEVLGSQALQDELKAKGSAQVKKYSWKKMIQQVSVVYESLV